MLPEPVNERLPAQPMPSRRSLLQAAAAAAIGTLIPGAKSERPPDAATSLPADPPHWMSASVNDQSRVVETLHPKVISEGVTDRPLLEHMLEVGITRLVDARTPREAWRRLLGKAERIVVKFNSVGCEAFATSEPVGRLLVEQLMAAGWPVERIVLVEAPPRLPELLRTAAPPAGWSGRILIGPSQEGLATWCSEADAIVNLAFLKSHRIALMSGCVKNMSHAVVEHPARYHEAAAMAECMRCVLSSADVGPKVRLNITNALRVLLRNGPGVASEDSDEAGLLLFSQDPVAADAVGSDWLDQRRELRGLPAMGFAPYLRVLEQVGVGRLRQDRIERVRARL